MPDFLSCIISTSPMLLILSIKNKTIKIKDWAPNTATCRERYQRVDDVAALYDNVYSLCQIYEYVRILYNELN